MAALIHVKAKGDWKNVAFDPKKVSPAMMTGFLSMQELTDYELIQGTNTKNAQTEKKPGNEDISKGPDRKTKKRTRDKKKIMTTTTAPGSDECKNEQTNKQKRKKKKLKKGQNKLHVPEVVESVRQKLSKKNKRQNKDDGKKKQTDKKVGSKKGNSRIIDFSKVVDLYAMGEGSEDSSPVEKSQKTSKKRKLKESDTVSPRKKIKHGGEAEKVTSQECTDMSPWQNLFVPREVLRGLAELGFSAPTPIQALVLPSAIRDKMDIVGAAETGSGKTLAFGIPLLHHILKFKKIQEEQNCDQKDNEVEDIESGSENESEEEEDMRLEEIGKNDIEDEVENTSDDEEGVTVLEMPAIAFESDPEDQQSGDEEYDLPPNDEDEDYEDLENEQTGCVRVVNNVTFDWLEEDPASNPDPAADPLRPLLALVLTPTRELAIQVSNHIKAASKYTDIRTVVVVGGMAPQKQERLLRQCPEVVVATPGRLWEMIQEGNPHLSKVEDIRHLVIDEADRMVEKGHFEELSRLLEMINSNEVKRKQRQNLVFSATLTMVHSGPNRYIKKKKKVKLTSEQKLEALMSKIGIADKPKVVDLTKKEVTAETLTEARITCTVEEKDMYLYYFLHRYPARTLVFCNSKDCVRRLVTVFTLLQCCPLPLHADMHQKQRLKNLDRFKGNPRGLLLATDVAARGLDIPDVQHVIHYQVPKSTENYVHRSGRTARALKEGLSVMLIGPEDQQYYRRIVKTLNRDEHLPVFPTETDYLAGIKPRVTLARQIDKDEHRVLRQKLQNSWFERAAREMEIDLDETQLHSLGSDREQAQHKHKIQAWKAELKSMLQSAILSRQFSGKYPTKSGKLEMPYNTERLPSGAVDAVKADKIAGKRKKKIRPNKPRNQKKKST